MRRLVLSITLIFLLCGCAKISHLRELMVLKSYSNEKDRQVRYVERQDKKFTRLLKAVQQGELDKCLTKRQALRSFGEPVYSLQTERDGVKLELWLYRYTLEYFDSDKVYLYFGPRSRLYDWEYASSSAADGEMDECENREEDDSGRPDN